MQFKRSLTLLLPDYIGIDLINLINQNGPNNRKSIENLLYHTNLNKERQCNVTITQQSEK